MPLSAILLALFLASVHSAHSGGEWGRLKKPLLFEARVPSSSEDVQQKQQEDYIPGRSLPTLPSYSGWSNIRPIALPSVAYGPASGSVVSQPLPIDGYLGLSGEQLNKPGFIFNTLGKPSVERYLGPDNLISDFGMGYDQLESKFKPGFWNGLSTRPDLTKLFKPNGAYNGPAGGILGGVVLDRPNGFFDKSVGNQKLVSLTSPITESLFPTSNFKPLYKGPYSPNFSTFLPKPPYLGLTSLAKLPSPTAYPQYNRHLDNGFYSSLLKNLLSNSLLTLRNRTDVNYTPDQIIRMFQSHGLNPEALLREPYIMNILDSFRRPVATNIAFSEPDYNHFHNILSEIIDTVGLEPERILKKPKILLAVDSIRRSFGNTGFPWDNNRLNYLMNHIIHTYGENARFLLKEPYTWYLLSLLSSESHGIYPAGVDYKTVFKTLNDLVNTDGIFGHNVLTHPYIQFTLNSLHRPTGQIHLLPGVDYNTLYSSLGDVIENYGLNPDAILEQPNVWNLINSLKRLHGNYGHPSVDNKAFSYYLNYIIKTYGKQAGSVLREPYTWYILSLLSKVPIEGNLPEGVDYKTVFRTLNNLINNDGIRAEAILQHPYILNTVNLLGNTPYNNYPAIQSVPIPSLPIHNFYRPDFITSIFPSEVIYKELCKKLEGAIESEGLDGDSLVNLPQVRNIINTIGQSAGDSTFLVPGNTIIRHLLNQLIETYGNGAEGLLKEPLTWYFLSLYSQKPIGDLPIGMEYTTVISKLNDLINLDGKHYKQILNNPYIAQVVNTLRQPRETANYFIPMQHSGIYGNYMVPSAFNYNFLRRTLKNIVDTNGLNFELIREQPSIWYVINTVGRSFGDHGFPYVDNDSFDYYLKYVLKTYGKSAEYLLNEPYTWYIMSLLSKGPVKESFVSGVDYKTLFRTLNDLINTEGKHAEDILKHPYISYAISSLRQPRGLLYPSSRISVIPGNHLYQTELDYEYIHKTLSDIVDTSGLNGEVIQEHPLIRFVVNSISRSFGDVGFPNLDNNSFNYYLNYVIKTYGKGAEYILKEPYTWYIINLMSRGPVANYLPQDVNYKTVFSALNDLINTDGKHAEEILKHPYVSHAIESLRQPRGISFPPSPSYLFSPPIHRVPSLIPPIQSFSPLFTLAPTLQPSNLYPSQIDYKTYHRKLNGIIERCGLKPEAILKEPDLWYIVNSIRHSNGEYGFPLLNNKSIEYLLNYIIKHFEKNADTILKEPYTWYVISLLSQGPINDDIPSGVDYKNILNKLNDCIVTDGLHGEDILKQPDIWSLINSLRHSKGNGLYPQEVDYKPFYKLLDELIKTNGATGDKQLREHYIWYIVNSLQHSTGNQRFPSVDYKTFNNLLNYIIKTYGKSAEGVLREPYTWYILSLLSDGSISHLTKNGALPPGIDYKTFYDLLNYLIKTHGKDAEGILKEPYVWYVLNTLKSGSTPVKYGKNVNEVEELTNMDGTQYLVYSTYNKTWVHPTLAHGEHTGVSGSESQINQGSYGRYGNKLIELMNAVIHSISGGGQGVAVIPGGQITVESHGGPGQVLLEGNGGSTVHTITVGNEQQGGNLQIVTSGEKNVLTQHESGANGFGQGGSTITIHKVEQHSPGGPGFTIIPGGSAGEQHTLGGGGGGGGLTTYTLGGGGGTSTVTLGGSGGGGGLTTYTLGGGGATGGGSSTVTLGGNGGGGGFTTYTLGGGGSTEPFNTSIGGSGGTAGNGGSFSSITVTSISDKNNTTLDQPLETLKSVLGDFHSLANSGTKEVEGNDKSKVSIQWVGSKPLNEINTLLDPINSLIQKATNTK